MRKHFKRGDECPQLDDLAAFAEGALEGRARRRVAAHVNRCEACLELVADTMRFLAEEAAEEELRREIAGEAEEIPTPGGGGGEVVPHPGAAAPKKAGPGWPALSGLAAAAALVVVAIGLQLGRGPRTDDEGLRTADQYASILDASAGTSFDGWPVQRRPETEIDDGLSERARSVRVGARLVDLELALRRGDRAAAATDASELERLAEGQRRSDLGAGYRELSESLRDLAEEPQGLAELVALLEESLRESVGSESERYLALGMAAEAARWAAAGGDRAYLERPGTGDELRRLAGEEWPGDVEAAFVEVLALLDGSPLDLPALAEALDGLLKAAG